MDPAANELTLLAEKVKKTPIPEKLAEAILIRIDQLGKLRSSPTYLPEFDRINRYVNWVTLIPWEERTQDFLDLKRAKTILDKNHFGLEEIKERVLEYISVMKLKLEKGEGKDVMRAPILCFVGLVGTGKTTIASSIAEALGRKFARIPFGGMGDALDLRGQSRMLPDAEPGKIIKSLIGGKSRNPVILLDEIDRTTDSGRASIMGVLVELLDPQQNHEFVDHYIDYPVDLSEVLFIATANNTQNISTAVMDRIEPIAMPSYSDAEKITIARDYILPRKVIMTGIPRESLIISEEVWPSIVRPLGFDAGIRTLERTIDGITRKVAKMLVEGTGQTFKVTPENIKQFLPQ